MKEQHLGARTRVTRRELVLLAALVAAALLIRLYAFRFHPAIEGDGIHYASLARDMLATGDLSWGLSPYRASLYQYLVAGAAVVAGDVHLAGKWVSALAGALLVVPLWLLARTMFSRPVAWITAALVVVHQALLNYSAMLFTESVFLLLLWTGLYAGWRGIMDRKPGAGLISGLLLGLAATAHPQGIGSVFVPLALAGLQFVQRGRDSWRRLVWSAGLLLLGFGFLVGAFTLAVRLEWGQSPWSSKTLPNLIAGEDHDAYDPARTARYLWTVDESGQGYGVDAAAAETSVLGYILAHPLELAGRMYRNLGRLDREILQSALRPSQFTGAQTLFAILVGLGLFGAVWSKRTVPAHLYLGTVVAFNFLSNSLFFFHDRLLLPIVPAVLIWCALGMLHLGGWFGAMLGNQEAQPHLNRRLALAGWAVFLTLCLVLVANYVRLAPTLIGSPVHEKEVGLWMRENLPQNVRLMADNPYTAYYFYTGTQAYVRTPYENYERFIAFAQEAKVDYLLLTEWVIVDWDFPIKHLFGLTLPEEDLELLKEWRFESDQRARLFRVLGAD
jgi:hypothetical protein